MINFYYRHIMLSVGTTISPDKQADDSRQATDDPTTIAIIVLRSPKTRTNCICISFLEMFHLRVSRIMIFELKPRGSILGGRWEINPRKVLQRCPIFLVSPTFFFDALRAQISMILTFSMLLHYRPPAKIVQHGNKPSIFCHKHPTSGEIGVPEMEISEQTKLYRNK